MDDNGGHGKGHGAGVGANAYTLTYPDGEVQAMTVAEYQRTRLRGDVPTGTLVQHANGWFMIGRAAVDDPVEHP